ncbi:MAG: hypothetical protein HY073_05565 [Deltaproteobacteria bacterium]|nr:hypothetical protein [Deltaproteobacteria bacterium]
MALKTRYSPLQHFTLNNVMTSFGELPPRNKVIALSIVGGVLLLLFLFPLSLLSGKVNSFKKEISVAQKDYSQILDKISAYQNVKGDIAAMEDRFGRSGGSLTSKIENMAKQNNLTVDQLKEKAPQETDYLEINSVEAKFSNISLSDLLTLLYGIENDTSMPMQVRRLQIKPRTSNRQVLDVTCEVASFVLKKES